MSRSGFLVLAALLPFALGQGVGTNLAENHPTLTWSKCTGTGGTSCTAQSASIVIDANWRWVHNAASQNCYTGNTWDSTICPDAKTCAANCELDGADYSGTYGITTSGNALTLKFVTVSQQPNIGSRVYLLAPGSTSQYQTFDFRNQEFSPLRTFDHLILNGRSFDVDVSQLPCGLNGALYFSQMDADGGVAKSNGVNKAGPKYGTGYCDAQCPRDLKFINGVANSAGWVPSPNDTNAGTGTMGTCCPEMDVWEANSVSAAFTPHPCTTLGQSTCTGAACSAPNSYARFTSCLLAIDNQRNYFYSTQGTCDQAGCDFNSYRMGDTSFYGPGLTVDTKQKFTVVTQFVGSPINQINRFYVQNGKVIPNSQSTVSGVTGNSISDSFCAAQKTAFGDTNTFASKGGLATMSSASRRRNGPRHVHLGISVLFFRRHDLLNIDSIKDDHAANMLWLDSAYPPNKSASSPGVARGTCSPSSGAPTTVEAQSANAQVVYSNIKFGPIGSTFKR
ncbi:glycoside hydrolase [Mycena olivaceomarginata]|nr:glycoside hydrolase [Mycena olivaceomarginata]